MRTYGIGLAGLLVFTLWQGSAAFAQSPDEQVCNDLVTQLCGRVGVGRCFADETMWQDVTARCEGHVQTMIEMEREANAESSGSTTSGSAPEDTVRIFYTGPELPSVLDPQYSHSFASPVLDTLIAHQTSTDGACIDFDPALDAQDYDAAEIERTLRLTTQRDGDSAVVNARFSVFSGAPRSIDWMLEESDSNWLVSDIVSRDDGWALSGIDCNAGATAAQPADGTPSLYPRAAASWGGIVRSGPGRDHGRLASLAEGEPVTLLHDAGNTENGYAWLKIEYRGGQEGYQWGGILCNFDSPAADVFEVCN